MYNLVIADTSCLIVLQNIARLNLLQSLFNRIVVTPEVQHEFGEPLPTWIDVQNVEDISKKGILELELDEGEASSIALGLENKDHCVLLIDERKGRRIAEALGLKITGTLGILIRAKEQSLITSLKDEIEALKQIDFRMSAKLISDILNEYPD